MISGLNQDVEILGRTFHFQTELSDQNGLAIRTEVFVGGKVVATRENRLEVAGPQSDEAVRGRMKEQHNRTLEGFVERARRYRQRGAGAPGEPPSPQQEPPSLPPPRSPPSTPAAAPSVAEGGRSAALAPPEVTEAAGKAIRIRRFFGRFRKLLGAHQTTPPDNLAERFEVVSQAFEWMIQSSLFAEIRIDEQVRCHFLKEQVEDWLASDRDAGQAAQIWSGIMNFKSYLAEINLRSDLVSFDQQLLVWAIDEVYRRGMTDDVFERLQALYGRHPKLDRQLDQREGVSKGAWIAHLRSVLTLI